MKLDPDILADLVKAGDRRALGRAITLVESSREEDRRGACALLEKLATNSRQSNRIGISGAPGVGKSSLIECLGLHVARDGRSVAVLSIDPSSANTGGSILGDKTRMEQLSQHERAFIRPSPAGHARGGVAPRTREAILLCEAAGFEVVIVETVGVGQTEAAVVDMTDMFILLLSPSGGDELQGIKRGIMELADLVLVNKADGDLLASARRTAADFRLAIGLLQPRSQHWRTPVELCSARTGNGIPEIWETVCRYQQTMRDSGELQARRATQARAWMWTETTERLIAAINRHPEVIRCLPELEAAVTSGSVPPSVAAQRLLALFLDR